MTHRVSWTPDKVDRIREMAGKYTVDEIADEFGCKPQTIKMCASRHGISIRYVGRTQVCPMCGKDVTKLDYDGICLACHREQRNMDAQRKGETLQQGVERAKAIRADLEAVYLRERSDFAAGQQEADMLHVRNSRLRAQLPKGHPLKCGKDVMLPNNVTSALRSYTCHVEHFDLDKIYESGQVFRWRKLAEHCYIVPAFGELVIISQSENTVTITGTWQEDLWKHYLSLDEDYDPYIERMEKRLPKEVVEASEGIRVINQDFFECAITFILSQNNNIPRIKKNVNTICHRTGNGVDFPDAKALSSLPECGLGYRHEYILAFAAAYRDWAKDWFADDHDFSEAFAKLQEFKGIGPKVANCICLYGLGHKEACPIDVWIARAAGLYGIGFGGLEDIAGIAQQYVYYWIRNKQ